MQWCSWFLTSKDKEVSHTDTSHFHAVWIIALKDGVFLVFFALKDVYTLRVTEFLLPKILKDPQSFVKKIPHLLQKFTPR